MLALLIDFVNVGSWSAEVLLDLYRKHRITHEPDLLQGSTFQTFCVTDQDNTGGWVWSQQHDAKQIQFHHYRHFCLTDDEPPKGLSRPVRPSQPEHHELWDLLLASQTMYRSFLDGGIEGRINLQFINHRLASYGKEFMFTLGVGAWEPRIELRYFATPTLEDWVDREIFIALLQGGGEILSMVRKCPRCGIYCVANRPKQKFCSDKCRRDYHNERRVGRV